MRKKTKFESKEKEVFEYYPIFKEFKEATLKIATEDDIKMAKEALEWDLSEYSIEESQIVAKHAINNFLPMYEQEVMEDAEYWIVFQFVIDTLGCPYGAYYFDEYDEIMSKALKYLCGYRLAVEAAYEFNA